MWEEEGKETHPTQSRIPNNGATSFGGRMRRATFHEAGCLWFALSVGIASARRPAQMAQASTIWPNLDPDARAILYAPFIWGADPRKGADLYEDAHMSTFRRDARLLREVGATTLVLEPTSSTRSESRPSHVCTQPPCWIGSPLLIPSVHACRTS